MQNEVADRLIGMLKGAMREVTLGRPDRLDTDVGPVITVEARATILRHIEAMRERGFAVFARRPAAGMRGRQLRGADPDRDPRPVGARGRGLRPGGPCRPLCGRTRSTRLLQKVNALGYGLTFGIHSRIDETIARASDRINAGNIYVNRNIIGAVVGVQPFGGHGLSGTGPKAGGPLYLRRLLAVRPAATGLPPGTAPQPFHDFLAFLGADGAGQADCDPAALAGIGAATPCGVRLDLPGPVGEQNTYRLVPRGAVLCVAATRGGAIRQIAVALATGNRALVACDADTGFLDRLPPPLRVHIARAPSGDDPAPSAALFEGEAAALQRLATDLAERDGPVVPIYALPSGAGAEGSYPLEYLLAEQAISVNTAAAGGNATLMTIG